MWPQYVRQSIQTWWHEKVDHFILQQAQLGQKNFYWVKEEMLYVEPTCDFYKILWCEFPKKLENWLTWYHHKSRDPIHPRLCRDWTIAYLVNIHRLNTELRRVVDFWVDATLEGYIIEFVAKNHQSFSHAEAIFKFGIRGQILKEIPRWIKILLVEDNLLKFQPNKMVD